MKKNKTNIFLDRSLYGYGFSALILSSSLFIPSLYAQVVEEETIIPVLGNFPQFFVCLLAGVLLAMGFQVFLTMLSVASGISLMGNVEKKTYGTDTSKNIKDDTYTDPSIRRADLTDTDDESTTGPIFKVTSTIGIWAVLTASLSLFFASLLAVKLSLVDNDYIGITLGLVIWATFFSLMTYLELRSVTSLLGGLFNTALQGFRASVGAVGGAVGRVMGFTEEAKAKNTARATADAIRDELGDVLDVGDIQDKIQEYVEKMRPPELDYRQIKREIADLINHLEIEERFEPGPFGPEKRTFLRLVGDHHNLSPQDLKKISQEFEGDESAYADNRNRRGGGLEDYFLQSDRSKLTLDNMKKDLEEIFRDPRSLRQRLPETIEKFNRSSLTQLLSQRRDIPEQEINMIADYAATAIDYIKEKIATLKQDVQGAPASKENVEPQDIGLVKDKMEQKVKDYFNSLNRPELNYLKIRRDFERIFNDPKITFKVLKQRLDQLDRQSLIAILSSSENISRSDAEKMVGKIEEAKETVLRRKEEMENYLKQTTDKAKREAVHQAENLRKGAMSASWWLFASALISGVASAVGGLLA